MLNKYNEYDHLNLPRVAEEQLLLWEGEQTFEHSVRNRPEDKPFVFFEGPPSANGKPGIHHVMGRTIKDIVCRYKTLQGFRVLRKAGWDTHGLPVELGVEKELGITKEDIGKTISVDAYNQACKKAVMRYTDLWNELTRKMGYWVDMDDPYVTYQSKYMETVWWLLRQAYDKGLLYKGFTIQPYSPKAGTGLSTHELNQPGAYRDVKDTTVVAQFAVKDCCVPKVAAYLDEGKELAGQLYFLAWTTTPWTLPSNTALAVGPDIDYVIVNSINKYSETATSVVLAEALVGKHFPVKKGEEFEIVGRMKGRDLVDRKYHQLLDYAQPMEDADKAFRVIPGDYVTTEDGTGMVHIAPTFGADDMKVAKDAGIPPMLVADANGNPVPLVDLQGRFVKDMGPLAGKYVKNEFYDDGQAPDKSVDVEIAIRLKEEGKAFNVEKYEHNYPHCWRTDKPVLYYPLDSWFVKVPEFRDRMSALNDTIRWKPASTGTGRFGNWLANANDWNLSRSRFWGIPIPIWRSEDGAEAICIGSVEELMAEIERSIEAGHMTSNPYKGFEPGNMDQANYDKVDLHKNVVDAIVLTSPSGKPMTREADLIDVWFDSGSMPYAQWHYPFENKEKIDEGKAFPADFIAEGVDQTRGWFYTLHAIATMCFDSVAYKSVISNGLVLDKNGQKMSKRLGNAVDPFETLDTYGPDATRWYMITNAQPWDNLKFDLEGIEEVRRKFFGTLYNTYAFFALYANLDNFHYEEADIPQAERPEIDRWILSKLNTLVGEVTDAFEAYEPTRAGRAIQEFVTDQLSNWYVRLCRRRFWKGQYGTDKISAYQTLYTCLETVARLASPIAPFYTDRIYRDLTVISRTHTYESVHLSDFPKVRQDWIDTDLEARMDIAQRVTSMVLSLRKKEKQRVRQPLQKVMIPVLDATFEQRLHKVEDLILSEVNVREMEYLKDTTGVLVKRIKPDFKALGPKYGKQMKDIAAAVNQFDQDQIGALEKAGSLQLDLEGGAVEITLDDVHISTDDIPGWSVVTDRGITVALDVTLTEELRAEGIAREFVNRIQNMRKDSGFDVTDRIHVRIANHPEIAPAVHANLDYICSETLADRLEVVDTLEAGQTVELSEEVHTRIAIEKLS